MNVPYPQDKNKVKEQVDAEEKEAVGNHYVLSLIIVCFMFGHSMQVWHMLWQFSSSSVCMSICHTFDICQNDYAYHKTFLFLVTLNRDIKYIWGLRNLRFLTNIWLLDGNVTDMHIVTIYLSNGVISAVQNFSRANVPKNTANMT